MSEHPSMEQVRKYLADTQQWLEEARAERDHLRRLLESIQYAAREYEDRSSTTLVTIPRAVLDTIREALR